MLGFLKHLIPGGAKDLASSLATAAGVFKPNSEKQAERDLDGVSSARAQYAKEFLPPSNWFDSLVNGLNRLVRPVLAFGIIFMFGFCGYMAYTDPHALLLMMNAVDAIPTELWGLMSALMAFYLGLNGLSKSHKFKIDSKAVEENIRRLIEKDKMKHERKMISKKKIVEKPKDESASS